MPRLSTTLCFAAGLLTAVACADDSDPADEISDTSDVAETSDVGDAGDTADLDSADVTEPAPSVAEELGLLVYGGSIEPIEEFTEGNITSYTFDPEEGPMCMRGADFRTGVRDTGSDSLVIFLQGGGACWSEFCLAVTGAPAGVPAVDILDPEQELNPTADWNVVYLPYCDGSFFAGDMDHDDDLNGNGTRYHRGLANLTGALEVAAMRFPDVDRVLLAGSSGGAYGLLLGTPMVRHYFPNVELIVMADSGIGLAREGEPEFIQIPVDEFNLGRFIPDECEGCITSGHLTAVVDWYLERDPNVRIGMFSSWYDSVLGNTFLQIEPDRFADALRTESDRIRTAFPDRVRRFIVDGTQHTSLLSDPTGIIGTDLGAVELPPGALQDLMGGDLVIGGLENTVVGDVNMSVWLSALIDNDLDVWVDLIEERGPAPE